MYICKVTIFRYMHTDSSACLEVTWVCIALPHHVAIHMKLFAHILDTMQNEENVHLFSACETR